MTNRCRWPMFLLLFFSIWVAVGRPAEAKNYAYVVSRDLSVLKLDTDTDTVVSRQTLPLRQGIASGGWNVHISGPDNLLLVSYSTSQTKGDVNDFRIAAFDLRSLTLKKDLGMVWPERPRVLIPPTGPHFFILWFDPDANNGQGLLHATRYSKATLASLGDLPQAPEVQQTVFSADGNRLYSFAAGRLDPIRIFNATDLGLVASLDTSLLVSPQGFGASIHDLQGDRALVVQNIKPIGVDPGDYALFTVRLPDGASSTRIVTGLQGKAFLVPPGEKILLNEETIARTPGGTIREVRSVGRLHIYNVATAAKLGQISVPVHGGGGVWAVHPRGDKVYFRSRQPGDQNYTVGVVSLTTFNLVKELQLPSAFLFFVEENP